MGDVLHLIPDEVGENFRFDPDAVLEDAKGYGFGALLIIGQCGDDAPVILGNCNAGEALVLMEIAKRSLVFGE